MLTKLTRRSAMFIRGVTVMPNPPNHNWEHMNREIYTYYTGAMPL